MAKLTEVTMGPSVEAPRYPAADAARDAAAAAAAVPPVAALLLLLLFGINML